MTSLLLSLLGELISIPTTSQQLMLSQPGKFLVMLMILTLGLKYQYILISMDDRMNSEKFRIQCSLRVSSLLVSCFTKSEVGW